MVWFQVHLRLKTWSPKYNSLSNTRRHFGAATLARRAIYDFTDLPWWAIGKSGPWLTSNVNLAIIRSQHVMAALIKIF